MGISCNRNLRFKNPRTWGLKPQQRETAEKHPRFHGEFCLKPAEDGSWNKRRATKGDEEINPQFLSTPCSWPEGILGDILYIIILYIILLEWNTLSTFVNEVAESYQDRIGLVVHGHFVNFVQKNHHWFPKQIFPLIQLWHREVPLKSKTERN